MARAELGDGVNAPPFYPWYEIPDDDWSELVAIADRRDAKTAVASNTRYWREGTNLPGLCGEWVYELLSGQPMNRAPEIWDDGEDFPGVDVKAMTNVRKPYLQAWAGSSFKAPYYFGAVVDLAQHLVKPLGYATREMLENAREYDYGKRAPARRIAPHDLLSADVLFARSLSRLAVA